MAPARRAGSSSNVCQARMLCGAANASSSPAAPRAGGQRCEERRMAAAARRQEADGRFDELADEAGSGLAGILAPQPGGTALDVIGGERLGGTDMGGDERVE